MDERILTLLCSIPFMVLGIQVTPMHIDAKVRGTPIRRHTIVIHKRRFQRLAAVLDHWTTQTLLFIALAATLFMPDLWVIANPSNEVDNVLNGVLLFFFVVFSWEIVVTSLVRDDYYRSAFFWMDVVGTLSIVTDLTWASEVLALSSGADPGTLRAARVAKLGAKAGRLAKLTKLFKFLSFGDKVSNVQEVTPAKRISAKMGMLLSQRVALLIMTIVILNPFLSLSITDYSGSGFLLVMDEVAGANAFSASEWTDVVSNFEDFYVKQREGKGANIEEPLWLKVHNIGRVNCPEASGLAQWKQYAHHNGLCMFSFQNRGAYQGHVRVQNKHFASGPERGRYGADSERCSARAPEFALVCNQLQYIDAMFDHTEIAVTESWLSIGMICMVIILLVGFTATFNIAIDDLVVKPISRIMDKLRKSTEVVLKAVEHEDEDEDDDNALSEADVLEKMVNKLARIVQKSMGNKMQDMLDANRGQMDATTTAWLSTSYSGGTEGSQVSTTANTSVTVSGSHNLSQGALIGLLPVDVDVINSFEFDVLVLDGDQLLPVVRYMFDRQKLLCEFGVNGKVFDSFVGKIRAGYRTEPRYHSYHHGCDVMHTVYIFLNETGAGEYMSNLEFFASLVAALAHDVGHPGVNNGFLVRTKDELALLHNDLSPLENMHAATLYEIMRDPTSDLMASLSEDNWKKCRKQILTCILNTDMAFHFDNLKKLEMFEEVSGFEVVDFLAKRAANDSTCPVPECLSDPATRLLLQETFLHAADLSNPVKPPGTYEKWVERVTDEFFAQGDLEKSLGLPVSPMCDRDKTIISTMQLGFIDFIITPFYTTLFKLFPGSLRPLAVNLEANYGHYARLRIAQEPQDKEKINGKVAKIKAQLAPFNVG